MCESQLLLSLEMIKLSETLEGYLLSGESDVDERALVADDGRGGFPVGASLAAAFRVRLGLALIGGVLAGRRLAAAWGGLVWPGTGSWRFLGADDGDGGGGWRITFATAGEEQQKYAETIKTLLHCTATRTLEADGCVEFMQSFIYSQRKQMNKQKENNAVVFHTSALRKLIIKRTQNLVLLHIVPVRCAGHCKTIRLHNRTCIWKKNGELLHRNTLWLWTHCNRIGSDILQAALRVFPTIWPSLYHVCTWGDHESILFSWGWLREIAHSRFLSPSVESTLEAAAAGTGRFAGDRVCSCSSQACKRRVRLAMAARSTTSSSSLLVTRSSRSVTRRSTLSSVSATAIPSSFAIRVRIYSPVLSTGAADSETQR